MPKRRVEDELLSGWLGVYGVAGYKTYFAYKPKSQSVRSSVAIVFISILTLGFYVMFSEVNNGMKGKN